jgi:N-formylglutamate deformylase
MHASGEKKVPTDLRSVEAVTLHGPEEARAVPIVYDSPHSGRRFPADFAPAVPLEELVGYEDRFVDDLIADAPACGIQVLVAEFPRSYIDPNRAVDDLDEHVVEDGWHNPLNPTDYGERGIGLVFRKLQSGKAIYDHPLSHAELERRIEGFWRPFHARLDAALDAAVRRWGVAWHVDWHSMRPVGDALSPDPGADRPDFVVSDRDGASAAPVFTAQLKNILESLGYSVAINEPFKGGYVIQRAGRPDEGRHSLQVEINRALYLDPDTLERSSGFDRLRGAVARASAALADWARNRMGG